LSYTKFKESTDYKTLEKDYIAKTDAMANKMGLSGKKAAPSDSSGDVKKLLEQYAPKKGS
jgi:hypothetical protein